jgi:ribonuclease D
MTNDEGNPNAQMTKEKSASSSRHSDFGPPRRSPGEDRVIPSSLDIRHSSFDKRPVATAAQLAKLVKEIETQNRIAIDTEADSLHSYREKLCLLQVSLPDGDYVVDPLADVDLARLCSALAEKEIVLHGADFDLRLLRRSLNLVADRIFDTVIAARLLGIREFSLAALVERYFNVKLTKGSQKANWGRRPLPTRMLEYAINDTHYLLPLAYRLERELLQLDRLESFGQSCQRAIEQAALSRIRDEDEVWRISGSGALRGRAAAVLRALWHWREAEAARADRPPFHILQNEQLIRAAQGFASEQVPDYRHFSPRRRKAFRDAAERALQLSEAEWPVARRRFGSRPTADTLRRTEELRRRRDHAAKQLGLEPSFVAPRAALEAIAADPNRAENLLVPWQRQLLELS